MYKLDFNCYIFNLISFKVDALRKHQDSMMHTENNIATVKLQLESKYRASKLLKNSMNLINFTKLKIFILE